jgi:hypothetical protein
MAWGASKLNEGSGTSGGTRKLEFAEAVFLADAI